MNLNHLTGESCLQQISSKHTPQGLVDMGKLKSWRVWLGCPDLQIVMSSNFVQQGEVLGLIALSFHWVMSTNWIQCVITGSLDRCWNCTQSISGLHIFTGVLCHELGVGKNVAKVGGLNERGVILTLLFTSMTFPMTEMVRWSINLLL